jgi:hypothetical protein
MKLDVYVIDGETIDIRPAPATRQWMDETLQHFAYRCLPLNIANAHGWEILCPETIFATWNGGRKLSDITVMPASAAKDVLSHFGHGILTFRVHAIFRTEPGYDLQVQGPINRPKDAISPLTGIIETDWSPYTFTMNWQFTRSNATVEFAKGEPICHVFPIQRGLLETVEPRLHLLSDDPELKRQRDAWRAERDRFIDDLKQPGSDARARKWQKHYYLGQQPDGSGAGIGDHHIKLRVKPFHPASGSKVRSPNAA